MNLVIKKVEVLECDFSDKTAVYKAFCRRRYAGDCCIFRQINYIPSLLSENCEKKALCSICEHDLVRFFDVLLVSSYSLHLLP